MPVSQKRSPVDIKGMTEYIHGRNALAALAGKHEKKANSASSFNHKSPRHVDVPNWFWCQSCMLRADDAACFAGDERRFRLIAQKKGCAQRNGGSLWD